MEDNNNQKFR